MRIQQRFTGMAFNVTKSHEIPEFPFNPRSLRRSWDMAIISHQIDDKLVRCVNCGSWEINVAVWRTTHRCARDIRRKSSSIAQDAQNPPQLLAAHLPSIIRDNCDRKLDCQLVTPSYASNTLMLFRYSLSEGVREDKLAAVTGATLLPCSSFKTISCFIHLGARKEPSRFMTNSTDATEVLFLHLRSTCLMLKPSCMSMTLARAWSPECTLMSTIKTSWTPSAKAWTAQKAWQWWAAAGTRPWLHWGHAEQPAWLHKCGSPQTSRSYASGLMLKISLLGMTDEGDTLPQRASSDMLFQASLGQLIIDESN